MEKKQKKLGQLAGTLLIVMVIMILIATIFFLWDRVIRMKTPKEQKELALKSQINSTIWNNCLEFSYAESQQISELLKKNINLQRENDSLIKVIKSLKSENLILNKKIKKCSQKKEKKRPVRKVNRKKTAKKVIRKKPVEKAKIKPIVTVVKTLKTVKTASSEAASRLTGLSDFVLFSIRLNGNEGNWFPQIAYDRDQKKFSHSVENPTGDGMNFKIKRSQFTNGPDGNISVTKSGKIYIKGSAVAPYLRKKQIVEIVVWTGTTKGFQRMKKEGDYWVYSPK